MKLFKSLTNWINTDERKNSLNIPIASDKINNEKVINIIYMEGFVTITFSDYETLMQKMSRTDYENIKNITSKNEMIFYILKLRNITTSEKKNSISRSDLYIFSNNSDFEIIGDKVFLLPCKLELPELFIAAFIEILEKKIIGIYNTIILEEHYQALKMFWYKTSLARNEVARKSLYNFITKNNISITNTGNFLGFRTIWKVNKNEDDSLVIFISKEWSKVKGWKKSPKNYQVFKDENGNFTTSEIKPNKKENNYIGNLNELYLELISDNSNRYTDDYTKSYDIRIGSVYKIKEEDLVLNSKGSCGGALHVSDGYNFSYSGYGDTPVVCIINPMHMIKTDTGVDGKCGVSQMFIAAVTSKDESGKYKDLPSDELIYLDELYHNESIEELQNSVQHKEFDTFTQVDVQQVIDIAGVLKSKVIENV